jgi:MoxR-like ATPase
MATKSNVSKNFIFTEKLEKAMNIAYATGENIILYGKGGHAKSEFTEEFFKDKGIVPYVKTLGSGTTTEQLFGGIDIKQLNESGKIEYLVENSFMNYEYVVFEELFDAPDYILEQLKDILTSKTFRNGTQSFPIKTKLIVCCTNKTREEFSKNDSLKALMERFPLEIKVEWKDYNETTYGHLFRTRMGKVYPELTYILAKLHIAGTTVSPRTAVKAARMIDVHGNLDCLEFLADFSGKNWTMVRTELEKFGNLSIIRKLLEDTDGLVKSCKSMKPTTADSIKDIKLLIKEISMNALKVSKMKVDDEMIAIAKGKVQEYTAFATTKLKEVEHATEKK